jgi:hypothetical protein
MTAPTGAFARELSHGPPHAGDHRLNERLASRKRRVLSMTARDSRWRQRSEKPPRADHRIRSLHAHEIERSCRAKRSRPVTAGATIATDSDRKPVRKVE